MGREPRGNDDELSVKGPNRPADSDESWIEVSDNGLGIAPEMHRRIFERFFRGHPDAAEGTGLGLAIVQESIQQMGSHLRV